MKKKKSTPYNKNNGEKGGNRKQMLYNKALFLSMSNTQNQKWAKKNVRHIHTNLMYALSAIWLAIRFTCTDCVFKCVNYGKTVDFLDIGLYLRCQVLATNHRIIVLVNLFKSQISWYAMPLILVPCRLPQYADDMIFKW